MGSEEISDSDLRDLYLESKLSIIPLKESFQPSGQSVALQSMSLGIPVMITDTQGFWQKDIFLDNENIIYINDFDYNLGTKKLMKYLMMILKLKKYQKMQKILFLKIINWKCFMIFLTS